MERGRSCSDDRSKGLTAGVVMIDCGDGDGDGRRRSRGVAEDGFFFFFGRTEKKEDEVEKGAWVLCKIGTKIIPTKWLSKLGTYNIESRGATISVRVADHPAIVAD
ncbi:hypothetical protein RHMOL_Rhmol05G0173900 [Rhododendron molle]|uniref:Uncharacterized protein n=1 Tax=Rhododendron molle TaxID=49168 RepID=A0ACC0NSH1_RHOML|nr:hypothetical protein RHMOL_Rhmol05G0173900 [Rhododendron molle]